MWARKTSQSGRVKRREGDRNTSGKNERRGKGRKLDTVEEESGSTEAEINGSKAEKKRLQKIWKKKCSHLYTMADVIQYVVVNRLPDVPDRPLHVSRRYDLMGPRGVLVGGQDPDLPPGHLLFMDVHRLEMTQWGQTRGCDRCQSGNTEMHTHTQDNRDLWERMNSSYSSLRRFN